MALKNIFVYILPSLLVLGMLVPRYTLAQQQSYKDQVVIQTDLSQVQRVTLPSGKKVITLPMGTKVIPLKNGKTIIKKEGEAPYCLVGCDFPIDCRGNKAHVPIPSGKRWACDNKPGVCVGHCYLEDKPGNKK